MYILSTRARKEKGGPECEVALHVFERWRRWKKFPITFPNGWDFDKEVRDVCKSLKYDYESLDQDVLECALDNLESNYWRNNHETL